MLKTYSENVDRNELMQGDVLKRTVAFDAMLKEVHPHFQRKKNLYFMVLTQSCDLVPRQGGLCKAPYISMVPVRSLDVAIQRQMAHLDVADVNADLPVMGDKSKSKLSEFLRRLHNNNESGYFYLNSSGTDLSGDCVAFLDLPIAIKSDIHYEKCLDAKILQLTDTFQAKLGWLVGQLYSRVGTEDWEPKDLQRKIAEIVKDAAIWVDDGKLRFLEEHASPKRVGGPTNRLTQQEMTKLIKAAPTKKELVLDQARSIIGEILGKDRDILVEKLIRRLQNDAALTGLLK